jgi:hypothetical protein
MGPEDPDTGGQSNGHDPNDADPDDHGGEDE